MVKRSLNLLIVATIRAACVIVMPFVISMANNQYQAREVLSRLATVQLPRSVHVVSRSSRVYNSGNSDGCDYEARVVVYFDGHLDALIGPFGDVLEKQYQDNKLIGGLPRDANHWSAKLSPSTTELHIDRDVNSPNHFIAILQESPRSEGLDIRCW